MRRPLSVLLAVLFIPQLVAAQAIAPGSRVRVTDYGEGTRTGTVVSLSADTIELRLADRVQSTFVPLARVTRLDVSRGREHRVLARAGVGFLVGAGAGAVLGAGAGSDCGGQWACPGAGGGALIGGVFFGSVGGVLGLLAGIIPSEKWDRVPLEARRVTFVMPSGNHPRVVGLSIGF